MVSFELLVGLFPVLFCSSPLMCRVLHIISLVLFPLFSPVWLRLWVFCPSALFPRVSPESPLFLVFLPAFPELIWFVLHLVFVVLYFSIYFILAVCFLPPAFMFLAFWLLDFRFLIYVDKAFFSSFLPKCLLFWSLFVKTLHWGNHPVLLQLSGAW